VTSVDDAELVMSGQRLGWPAVLACALGATLMLAACAESKHTPSAAALIGLTWQGPGGTVVFADHTARIFDGCTDELRQVAIGDGVLDLSSLLGNHDCLGRETGSGVFDRVLASSHLTWQRTGDTLQLTDDHGAVVELHSAGPAIYLADQDWGLESFVDLRDYEHGGDSAARLRIDNGTVHATDLCNELTGTATVTDTTITFTDMHSTDHVCPDTTSTAITEIIDHVLSGTVDYWISGRQDLSLSAPRGGFLSCTLTD
jgi:heat shock protein HslJ